MHTQQNENKQGDNFNDAHLVAEVKKKTFSLLPKLMVFAKHGGNLTIKVSLCSL